MAGEVLVGPRAVTVPPSHHNGGRHPRPLTLCDLRDCVLPGSPEYVSAFRGPVPAEGVWVGVATSCGNVPHNEQGEVTEYRRRTYSVLADGSAVVECYVRTEPGGGGWEMDGRDHIPPGLWVVTGGWTHGWDCGAIIDRVHLDTGRTQYGMAEHVLVRTAA